MKILINLRTRLKKNLWIKLIYKTIVLVKSILQSNQKKSWQIIYYLIYKNHKFPIIIMRRKIKLKLI